MIVPMKKVVLLCLASARDEALLALRDLGVLHLEPVKAIEGPSVEQARQALAEAESARQHLAAFAAKGATAAAAPLSGAEIVKRANDLASRRKAALDAVERLAAEEAAIAPLGDFDPEAVRLLRQQGIAVRIFHVPTREAPPPPAGAVARQIGRDAEGIYVAVFGQQECEYPGREIGLPARRLSAVRADLQKAKSDLAEIESALQYLAGYPEALAQHISERQDDLALAQAASGMAEAGAIAYLKGYCPEDAVPRLRAEAEKRGWGLRVTDPDENDAVPTLLRNPAWARPIELLLGMIGILPGYREADISKVFLLFYSVFFAMLVGDAGYGCLFLLLTAAIKLFVKRAPADLPRLLGVLSATTIIWGVLTGSYFGINPSALPAPLVGCKVGWLEKPENLMTLCFFLGAVHLSLAHLWNVIRLWPQPQVAAQLGWVAMCWVMFFMAQTMILGYPLPAFVLPMFLVALLAIAVFMTPARALKSEWYNHLMLPLTVVGNFG
ncbi:MAG: hypothetical protein N3A66_02175, partial [Planctomycetota bacterium]|nr:hypothetical protein [Planctomycetota bacterium]